MLTLSFKKFDSSKDYNTEETIEDIVTYAMNNKKFDVDTFGNVLEETVYESYINDHVQFTKNIEKQRTIKKIEQNDQQTQPTPTLIITNTRHQNTSVNFTLSKQSLKLLFNDNKISNITTFKHYMLELLKILSLDYDSLIEHEDDIRFLVEKTHKTMLLNKPYIDINSDMASDFYSKYLSILTVFMLESIAIFLKSEESIISKFQHKFNFPIDFAEGLLQKENMIHKNSEASFKLSTIENTVFGILKNTPKIRKNIEKFEFFKIAPNLEIKAHQALNNFEALANEYVNILHIDLAPVAKRNKKDYTACAKCKMM